METKIVLKAEAFNIIGAAMEVHQVVGCGFTEPLYQEAFEEELRLRGIPFDRERIGINPKYQMQNFAVMNTRLL